MASLKRLPKTKTKEKLMKEIDRQFPKISNAQITVLVHELVDVVSVFTKLATEPQLQIKTIPEFSLVGKRKKKKKTGEHKELSISFVEHVNLSDTNENK